MPKGKNVRPTSNRVREAIFNTLDNLLYFEEVEVIDLYAGSGALGLEALSHGAKSVNFVESTHQTLDILKKNIAICDHPGINIHVTRAIAHKWLPRFKNDGQLCLIFLDPPYHIGEYEKIMPIIAEFSTIPPDSVIVVESPRNMTFSLPSALETLKIKQYGNIKVTYLKKARLSHKKLT